MTTYTEARNAHENSKLAVAAAQNAVDAAFAAVDTSARDAAYAAAKGKRGAEELRAASDAAHLKLQEKATVRLRRELSTAMATEAALKIERDAAWLATASMRQAAKDAFNATAPASAPSPKMAIGTPSVKCSAGTSVYKSGKGWRQDEAASCALTIGEDWTQTVGDQGIANVDGVFTIVAAKIDTVPAGYDAFAARVVKWGRGYDSAIVDSVIVRENGRLPQLVHAETVEKGIALLRRRARVAAVKSAASRADLNDYRDVRVTFADSHAAGNCDVGTANWCARAGINAAKGATIGEILKAIANGAGQAEMAERACRVAIVKQIRKAA